MESITLNKGSIETVAVDLKDLLGNLTTLDDVTGLGYTIYDTEGIHIVGGDATNTDMTALCVIDTNNSGLVPGRYNLYINFTADTDSPVLGPVRLIIKDAVTNV